MRRGMLPVLAFLLGGMAGWTLRPPRPAAPASSRGISRPQAAPRQESEAVRKAPAVPEAPPAPPAPEAEPFRQSGKDGTWEGRLAISGVHDLIQMEVPDGGAEAFRERLAELLKLPAEQEQFLQDLPFLSASQLERFRRWDQSWMEGSLWQWPYDDGFAHRLSRKLQESLLSSPPDPDLRRPLAREVLNHWYPLSDEELEPVRTLLASDADPGLRGMGEALGRDLQHRRVDREPSP